MGTGPSSLYEGARTIRKADRKEDEPRYEYYVMDTRPQIEINASKLDKRFKLNKEGYLGEVGKGKGDHIREFVSSNPLEDARELFAVLANGAKLSRTLPKAKGVVYEHFDGTSIAIREITRSPNSPAVDIGQSVSSIIRNQKVHFVRRQL